MTRRRILTCIALLSVSNAAPADQPREATYQEKLADSDLVVIATATSINRGDKDGDGASAKLIVIQTLKGEQQGTIEVSTDSSISDLNPRCCAQGASYLMFLKRAPSGKLVSLLGQQGMVRVGGQLTYEPASTLGWCTAKPQPNSLIFKGSPEALTALESFTTKEAISLQACSSGKGQILILPDEFAPELPQANKILRAFNEGKFPGVEIGLVGHE